MSNQVAEKKRCRISRLEYSSVDIDNGTNKTNDDIVDIYKAKYENRKKLPFRITRNILLDITRNQSSIYDALQSINDAQSRLLDIHKNYKHGEMLDDISELEDAYRNLALSITRAIIPLTMATHDIYKETFLWRALEWKQ